MGEGWPAGKLLVCWWLIPPKETLSWALVRASSPSLVTPLNPKLPSCLILAPPIPEALDWLLYLIQPWRSLGTALLQPERTVVQAQVSSFALWELPAGRKFHSVSR